MTNNQTFLAVQAAGRPTLTLDLEICPKTGALEAAGWIFAGEGRVVGAGGLGEVLQALEQARAAGATLVGHNIRRFDLPHLWRLSQGAAGAELSAEAHRRWPELFGESVLDTLELSALCWPGRPTHRLAKLYRTQQSVNDPLADCAETLERLQEAQASRLPAAVQFWVRELLPAGALRDVVLGQSGEPVGYAEASAQLVEVLGGAAAQRLWAHLSGLPSGAQASQSNLGALVALHWLLKRHQPLHRRPAWAAAQWPAFAEAEAAALGQPDYSAEALRAELREIYGPDYDFRAGQLEMVQTTLRGEAVPLGLLPTGGGKSLTFQFPALLLSRRERALTVVLSPLTALMEDQVLGMQTQLPAYAERVAYISGTQSPDEQKAVLEGVWEGRIDLLYLSPERLRNSGMQRLLRHRRPALWVLDEAHTLSQWGVDFRPDFLRVAPQIARVHEGGPPPLLSLLTATATARVVDDLEEHLLEPLAEVLGGRPLVRLPETPPSPWRDEIATEVVQLGAEERLPAVRTRLLQVQGEGRVSIVYVRSRRLAEEYAAQLGDGDEHGEDGLRTAAFHARIGAGRKREVLRQFKAGELDVVVATSAFGMGIDRAGIHTVIHLGPPNTAESYLQEIGRVARKAGETGHAVLYWDERDFLGALRGDAAARVGRDSLQKCWNKARICLAQPAPQRWLSSQDFEGPLGLSRPEDVVTQTRVALRALEAYELLREGEGKPAELVLRWQDTLPDLARLDILTLGPEALKLLGFLRGSGRMQAGQAFSLDVLETGLLAGLSPHGVMLAARQLVAAGLASWSYKVTLRFRAGRFSRLTQVWLSLRALLLHWREHSRDADDLLSVDAAAVQADLSSRNKGARFDLALLGLRAFGLAHARKNGPRWSIAPREDAPPPEEWLEYAEARVRLLRAVWAVLEQRYNDAAEGLSAAQRRYLTLTLNMAELEDLLPVFAPRLSADERACAGAQASADHPPEASPMHSLQTLERLGMIDISRGDDNAAHIFRLEPGRRTRYNKVAFRPLGNYYADRTRRIHTMRLLLAQPSETARKQFVEDYFAMPLDDFCARYAEGDPDELTVAQLPGTRERILGGLSEAQRQVVTDSESRALLVLAGPGSGKTRTIVHRAAALLALENVPPEQILILAYNRTAVAEVRARLGDLLGPLGLAARPTVLTFHGLARKLTHLRATDAPEDIRRSGGQDAANTWLLEQLIGHLQEEEMSFRYILVDEYQDVDAQKYQIVQLLTRFVAAETSGVESDEEGGSDENNEDENEQESYLVAVGDDDQNIYGFQGASIRYIQQFRTDYQITAEAEVCLTGNYRAAPELVAFSNAFISAALPADERLKGPEQAISSRVEAAGQVGCCRYAHPYHAAHTVARKVQQLAQAGTPLHEIAVLAPRWNDLEATEHALAAASIATQRYSNGDEVRPAAGLLGRHLVRQLEDAPATLCPAPTEALQELCAPYSTCDAAFQPLQAALLGLEGETTYEVMAMRLRGAAPLGRDAVALSTFHSAKGSEFEQVFVLADHPDDYSSIPVKRTDAIRSLYVALTRAKRGLFLLLSAQREHPIFADEWLLEQTGLPRVPSASRPPQTPRVLRYTLALEPRDLFLSAARVVSDAGRQRVDAYAREWSELRLFGKEICVRGGPVAVLSGAGYGKLERVLRRGGRVQRVEAERIIYCERDDEWYGRAGYAGTESGHYLVLPRLHVEVPL